VSDRSVSVEDVLAGSLAKASAAGRWDVVAQLARELEVRRLDRQGAQRTVPERAERARETLT
jgi:hypothetical protein